MGGPHGMRLEEIRDADIRSKDVRARHSGHTKIRDRLLLVFT